MLCSILYHYTDRLYMFPDEIHLELVELINTKTKRGRKILNFGNWQMTFSRCLLCVLPATMLFLKCNMCKNEIGKSCSKFWSQNVLFTSTLSRARVNVLKLPCAYTCACNDQKHSICLWEVNLIRKAVSECNHGLSRRRVFSVQEQAIWV